MDRYGISDQLDQSQLAALEKVMVDIGHGRSRSVLNLVAGRASHITRTSTKRELSPDDSDDVWTAHDYVAR
ncbi:hypothetical protein ABN034_33825 [Actinopolymorpha sp. B11F2]|uniref:hypothetical protein n=1 Tax=Actinopolymorpha sp. B11F2 TaxID=3160862 RepID=UPI0032E4B5A6